ncbi:PRC-barrel domain-containing protein [Flexivirga alba]|uniref:PRC-barrel domain-containing protein n=1 Tax=Flexivirga alba TaxID=702742 RepID=A0ABW2AJM1_9MICO
MQFHAENIRDWRGRDVVDQSGHKVGTLESVYVDTTTDEPVFGCVTIGMIGRRRLTFVSLDGATVSPAHVKVTADKKRPALPGSAYWVGADVLRCGRGVTGPATG